MTLKSDYLIIGKIGAANGVRGLTKIISYADNPSDIFNYNPWYLQQEHVASDAWQPATVTDAKQQGKTLVARINDCQSREVAQQLTNWIIGIKKSQLPKLEKNEHYWHELTGLTVVTTTGINLGQVDHLFSTGANDVLVVVDKSLTSKTNKKQRRLIPFLKQRVVIAIDLTKQLITVDWDPDF